jgi:hypothetical protein
MKTMIRVAAAFALLFCLALKTFGATDWSRVYFNNSFDIFSVAFGNGKFVAGGVPPQFQVSSNLTNWTVVNAGINPATAINVDAIGFGHGLFVAGLVGQVAVSSNGTSWKVETLPVGSDFLYQAVYSAGLFVLTGGNGTIITSPDGTNWTVQATGLLPDSDSLYSIVNASNLFVATGDEGSVVTSPDGTNWTVSASGLGLGGAQSLFSITYGNGLYAAVGNNGTIVTSPDATNWTEQGSSVTKSNQLSWVTYGNGRFLAVGLAGMILNSKDGTNWVQDNSGTTADLFGATYYQNGQFVVVGGSATSTSNGTILVNQLPDLVPTKNGGCLDFTLNGLTGSTVVLQYTSSLAPTNWIPLQTNTIVNGTVSFSDCSGIRPRYYRAVIK